LFAFKKLAQGLKETTNYVFLPPVHFHNSIGVGAIGSGVSADIIQPTDTTTAKATAEMYE